MPEELQRILYVDDDPYIRSVAQLALESLGGFTLEICSSGREALSKAPGFLPQLVLLDMIMPEMNGLKTLGMLRKMPHFANTPVVFMTAIAQPDEIAAYRENGAVDVISKPFDPMSLSNQVLSLWERCDA